MSISAFAGAAIRGGRAFRTKDFSFAMEWKFPWVGWADTEARPYTTMGDI